MKEELCEKARAFKFTRYWDSRKLPVKLGLSLETTRSSPLVKKKKQAKVRVALRD